MKYACLIYRPEDGPVQTQSDMTAVLQEYVALSEEAAARGVFLGGERLGASRESATVRVRGGKRIVRDGPFAETKEVLGGFMVIEVPSFEEAIEFAVRIPNARDGSIEVRPIIERGG